MPVQIKFVSELHVVFIGKRGCVAYMCSIGRLAKKYDWKCSFMLG